MSKRCKIIPEQCIACGLCAIYAPEIFDYDEDGIVQFTYNSTAQQQFILPKQEEQVLVAYKKCPVRAILIED